MSMPPRLARTGLPVGLMLALAAGVGACDGPTEAAAPADALRAATPELAQWPVEVRQKVAELRQWSATFHDVDKAAEAGYDVLIGCIDERVNGVPLEEARGMGYHVTRGDVDIVNDGVIDVDEPEFLVYAPHPNDADLPPEERLGAARLVAFDYYIPDAAWPHAEPPEMFGEPLDWSEAFQGWVRHIWLWGHNPDGLMANFNPTVDTCTELL